MLRGAAAGATGLAGLAALAACGETKVVTKEVPVKETVIKEVPVEKIVRQTEIKEVPVEKIVTQQVEKIVTQTVEVQKVVEVEKVVKETVEVEKVVTKEVQVMVEAPPETRTVKIEHATDHTSGPRGAAMSWAIERFAVQRPDIKVKFIPQDHIYYEKIAIEAVAGTLSETNLLNGVSFQQFVGAGIWLQIDDILAKKDGYDPSNYWFQPDIYSDNRDQSYPYDATRLQGPLYGMPYQGALGGLMYNINLFEGAGATQPTEGMRYSDLLEEETAEQDRAPGGPGPFGGRGAWGSAGGRFDPCCAPDAQRRTLGEFGNLHERGLMDIWRGDAYRILVATYPTRALCLGCNMRKPVEGPA